MTYLAIAAWIAANAYAVVRFVRRSEKGGCVTCACPNHDAKLCSAIRYKIDVDELDPDDECPCVCHDDDPACDEDSEDEDP